MANESRPLRSIADEADRTADGERPYAERTRHAVPAPPADPFRAKADTALAGLNESPPDDAHFVLASAAVWADRLLEDARRLREEVRTRGLAPSPDVQNSVERVRHEMAHCTAAIERVRREIERARTRT